MRINADFSVAAFVRAEDQEWIRSPENGVDRIMLDRIGEEVARATSIVRYAPESAFPRHQHALGEEFLVLDGVFSDEHGDYPQGTYVRNPPGSAHVPRSDAGCRILVKLRQFDLADAKQFSVDTLDDSAWIANSSGGIAKLPLHRFSSENVEMWRLPGGFTLSEVAPTGGREIFVVQGSLRVGEQDYAPDSWLRYPSEDRVEILANEPSLLWVKSGHLPKA